MRVWVVTDWDWDNEWVEAVYATRELAELHQAAINGVEGHIKECDVLTEWNPDLVKVRQNHER